MPLLQRRKARALRRRLVHDAGHRHLGHEPQDEYARQTAPSRRLQPVTPNQTGPAAPTAGRPDVRTTAFGTHRTRSTSRPPPPPPQSPHPAPQTPPAGTTTRSPRPLSSTAFSGIASCTVDDVRRTRARQPPRCPRPASTTPARPSRATSAPFPYDVTPPSLTAAATTGDRSVQLSWQTGGDLAPLASVTVTRSPGAATVYSGEATGYTDTSVTQRRHLHLHDHRTRRGGERVDPGRRGHAVAAPPPARRECERQVEHATDADLDARPRRDLLQRSAVPPGRQGAQHVAGAREPAGPAHVALRRAPLPAWAGPLSLVRVAGLRQTQRGTLRHRIGAGTFVAR